VFQNDSKYFNFIQIMVVGFVQPLIFWAFLSLSYKTYSFKKPAPTSAKKMRILFMVICFVLQPYIIQISLEVLKYFSFLRCENLNRCQNYTPDLKEANYFMQENPSIRCFTGDHFIWSIIPGLIMALIWGFALPFLFFKSFVQEDSFYKNFFCEDFRSSKRYW